MASLRQEKSRYVVDFRDQTGRRNKRAFQDKREAQAFKTRIESELSSGSYRSQSHTKTVADLIGLYLEELPKLVEREEYSPNHASNIKTHLRRFGHHSIARLKLALVTSGQINRYADELRSGGMSAATAGKHLSSIRALFAFGQRIDWLATNPCEAVSIRTPRSEQTEEIQCPSVDEIRLLIDSCDDPELRIRLLFSALMGVRASELRALTWEDIDLDAKTISVSKAMDISGNIAPPKSKAGRRTIPLPPSLVAELKTWQLLHGSKSRVFTGIYDDQNKLRSAFQRLCRDCGLRTYRWHDLRHSFCSNLIAAGVPLVSVAKWAGHSYQVCADTYTHLFNDQGDNIRVALDTIFHSS